ADHTKQDGFQQKFQQDDRGPCADGFFQADDIGAFFYSYEHDVGDAEAAYDQGEDRDDPAAQVDIPENAFQLVLRGGDLVQRKIVLFRGFQAVDGSHGARQVIFQLPDGDVRPGAHHVNRLGITSFIHNGAGEEVWQDDGIVVDHAPHQAFAFFLQQPHYLAIP